MIVSFFALFLLASTFAAPDTTLPYTGVRVTFKQEMITDTIHTSLGNAVHGVEGQNLGNFEIVFGSGFFSSSFTAKDFTCASASYNKEAAKNPSLTINDNVITQNFEGPIITLSCKFQFFFKFMGMTLISNEASATMKTVNTQIIQILSGSDFLSAVGWTMDVSVTPSGFGYFGGISKLSTLLINGDILKGLGAMLGQSLTSQSAVTWDSWMNAVYPIYQDGSLDIIMKNSFRTVKAFPASYVTFGFNTALRVKDHPLIENSLRRVVNTNVVLGTASCQICIAASAISHILEVRKVDKDYLIPIDPKKIGLSGTVRDMFNLIPKLAERMPPSLSLDIGCSPYAVQLVRVADPTSTNGTIRVQVPVSCVFESERGETLLRVYMRLRGNIQNSIKITNSTWTIEGTVVNPTIYDMSADRAVEGTTTLYGYISAITQLLNGQIATAGLTVKTPFGKYTPKTSTMTSEEYCVNLS
jgi:hypothetical protein